MDWYASHNLLYCLTRKFGNFQPASQIKWNLWLGTSASQHRNPSSGSPQAIVILPIRLKGIFFRLSFRNCKNWVYNCDDLLSHNTSTNSQTTTPKLSTVRDKIWWAWPPCEWQEHHHCHGTLYMCLGNGVNQSFTKLHSGESDEAIK